VDAFLKEGLINGLVAKPGWIRTEPSLLEHDPLAPDFALPAWLPIHVGDWSRIGVSQAGEDEYRGVLADTGLEPREIWRAKYHKPGVWDGAGAASAMEDYVAGLQRRAYANTLWATRFASEAEARAAAPKIAAAAKLKPEGAGWHGEQPPYGPEKNSPGPIRLWQRGDWLLMSTLPEAAGEILEREIH
jgi:hypothetical protein